MATPLAVPRPSMAAPVHRPFGCPRVLGLLELLADRKTNAVAPRRSPRGVVTSSVNLLVRARPLVGLVAALANAHGTGHGGRAPYQVRLPLSPSLLLSFFLLGFVGIFCNQLLFILGLNYTSTTYAAAIQSSIPVLTFVLAAIMGVEMVNIHKDHGQGKVPGTLICVAGAILMVLYKGPIFMSPGDHEFLSRSEEYGGFIPTLSRYWHIGMMCLIGNCMCMATFLAVQAPLLAVYPTGLSLATYSYFFGGLLMLLTGAFICNNFSEWAISTSDLAALMCAGVITSALNYGHLVWSKKVLGPALMALYYPLQPVASAILSRIFLGSSIYMGRFCPELLLLS